MMPAEEIAPASMMQKWLVFNLLLRCICCIRSRCHSFCMLHFIPQQKSAPALFHRSYRCYIYVTPLGSVARNYRNVVCPCALRSLKTLRALNLGKNKPAVLCVEIADSCLRNTPRWGLGCDLLYCKGNPPQKIMLKNTIGV